MREKITVDRKKSNGYLHRSDPLLWASGPGGRLLETGLRGESGDQSAVVFCGSPGMYLVAGQKE